MKLDCINHALLTAQNILASDVHCCGWIANSIDTMPEYEQNLQTLQQMLPIPMIAEVLSDQTAIHLDYFVQKYELKKDLS